MKRFLVWAILCLLPSLSNGQSIEADQAETSAVSFVSEVEPAIQVQTFLGLGGALLFESSNDRRYQTSSVPPLISFGARFGSTNWSSRVEYANTESRDGNEAVSLLRNRESWMLWLSRDLGRAQGWVPYAALALGMSRRSVETRIANEIERVSGGWLGTAAGAGGFRANWSRSVTTKLEFRYELGDAQSFAEKTNDARLGVAAIVEILL